MGSCNRIAWYAFFWIKFWRQLVIWKTYHFFDKNNAPICTKFWNLIAKRLRSADWNEKEPIFADKTSSAWSEFLKHSHYVEFLFCQSHLSQPFLTMLKLRHTSFSHFVKVYFVLKLTQNFSHMMLERRLLSHLNLYLLNSLYFNEDIYNASASYSNGSSEIEFAFKLPTTSINITLRSLRFP